MGCAASTDVLSQTRTRRPQEPNPDLLVNEEDASSTVSDKLKYYLSSSGSSSCSSAVFSGIDDKPDHVHDILSPSTTNVETQVPNSHGKCFNADMADNNALERDTIDSSNEAIAFAEAHQTLVDDLKPNTSAECKVRIIEYPKKSLPDIGDTALSLQPLSASLEATRDFVGKSHDLPNETNSASDNASKHFKTSADTNATKSRTGTVTVGCCGSTKLLIADWGASKAASVSEVEASDCSGFNGEADHSGTTTGEGATKGKIFEDSSSLTSRPVIAGIDSEMLDLDYNAPKLRVPRTTKDVKLHPLPATTENSLTQEKPTKEPPVDKQLGVCSSTCTKMSNRKDEAETFERCGMERNLRKSDVSTSTGNLSVLHARKGKDVAVAGSSKNSEARHILHSLGSSMGSEVEPDAGLRHSQKSLSVHSFIAAEASESDAEESDKGHVQVEDATRRGAQTKTSKPNNSVKEQSNLTRRTRRIQPEGSTQDSNRAQPDSITTTKVSSDGRHRVASHHTAPRLERNLSNELQLLSRQNIPSKLDEATYSENALFDNSIILHQHRDAFADSDNDFEQATAKGMWKSQKDGDSTINKRLHKSPSGLEVETDKNAFHSVDMPSHGSMTAGMTLEIPNNEGNSTFVPLNDTGGESDSSFEDVFKKTKKKCRRDLKATRKEADDESLDRSLSPQMKSNEIAINTKPSDASISTELDHGTNSCNEHSKISSYDVDTDGFCTKSKRTSKPGLKKAKSSKKRRIKPENKPPADLEQISEDQDLPDWRARPAQRSGIFGIAGSICSPRMLDTNVLDTPQESSVSQERIVIPRDPKKKLSRQGLKNEEEVIEESREDAKQLKDEASSSGDSMFEFFNLLNLDPWRDNANKLDEEKITKIMRKHPQYCGKTYKFESFDGRILPLAALCALRATLSTIEVCFHAYETAGMMMDKMVGTPLHYASAYKASLEVVKYLVKIQPGSLRKRNQAERLPLHMACLFGASYDVISYLVEKHPHSCKKQDTEGMTPLHLLCDMVDVNPSVVRLIADEEPRACLKLTKQDGSTPLHMAIARKVPLSALRALVSANDTALSTKDEKGRIPLFVAVAVRSDIETFKFLLLKCPASRTTRNRLNELPVTMAARMNLNGVLLDLLQPI